MERLAVFGYASLVSLASASQTIGRAVTPVPARLSGWKRRWSQARDNHRSEKTFALASGELPDYVLGLNIERGEDPAGPVNGVLLELTPGELDRLDLREIRYDRVDVTDQIEPAFGRVIAYTAKASNYTPVPPPTSVILATYAGAVEAAFDLLGPGQLDEYLATTGEEPAPRVHGVLTAAAIPEGNPTEW